MVIRLFLMAFCFSVLFFSVSPKQGRSVAATQDIFPTYDASYKL